MKEHSLVDLAIELITKNGPAGETMPALRITITAASVPDRSDEHQWPPLVLPLQRAQRLRETLELAIADLLAQIHDRPGPVQ